MSEWGQRKRLPGDRDAIIHGFTFGDGTSGTLIVGLYENGTPGEIFLRVDREGSSVSGMCNAFAIAFSKALQYGAPLESLVSRLELMKFEPCGWSGDAKIGFVHSIVDYVMRWMKNRFLAQSSEPCNQLPEVANEV
jgi:ribonucleoside-diphosphate reductase alpha chain